MNCLSEGMIQMYIDGELSTEEMEQVEVHLGTCDNCAESVEVQRDLAHGFKASMNSLVNDSVDPPAFVQPGRQSGRSKKILFRVIYPIAAASILILFLMQPFKNRAEDTVDIYVISSFSGEIDANLPISDQEFEISFYDENGIKID